MASKLNHYDFRMTTKKTKNIWEEIVNIYTQISNFITI